jgi:hypothetical protein
MQRERGMSKISIPSASIGFDTGETFSQEMYGYKVYVQVVSPSWKDSEFIVFTEIDGKRFEQTENTLPESWFLQEFLFECILQAVKDGAKVVFP